MARTRIGLDVGSTAVRIVEVEAGERPSVLRLGQVPLPLGAVEAGEIIRPDQVTVAIRRLCEVSGIQGSDVYIGVESTRVVVREITLPWLPEKELRAALAFQAQDYLPMAAEEAVMDCQLLDDEVEATGQRMQRLLLVAAPRGSVNVHIDAVEDAGLVPVGVDLSPFAAMRATASGDDAGEAQALIDIGGHITSVILHRGGVVRLVRILPIGGRNVTATIARNLGIDESSAELLKRGEGDQLEGGMDRSKAAEAALEGAKPLVEDIASTIEFSLRQEADLDVAKVVLTGGGSHLDGLPQMLDSRIHRPVERGRIFGRARSRLAPELGALVEAGGSFSVAIGLALPEGSDEHRETRSRREKASA